MRHRRTEIGTCLGVYPTPSPEPKARSGHGLPCTLKQNALRATLKQNTRVTCASSPRALPGLRARAVGDAHRAREGAAAVHSSSGQRRQQYGLKRFVGHFLTGMCQCGTYVWALRAHSVVRASGRLTRALGTVRQEAEIMFRRKGFAAEDEVGERA